MSFKKYISLFVFLISAFLVLKVAFVSTFNAHPDEDSHYAVAQFYKTYNYIPAVNDSNADFTYSEYYGRSYINLLGLEYFFMGKFFSLFRFLPLEGYQIVRLFNFSLFFILGLYLFIKKEFTLFKFSLLITPQLLYVASYVNNDFFAYFMGSVVMIQIISRNSLINKFIKFGKWNFGLFLIFPISLFLLLTSKYNYIPLILAVLIYMIYKYRKQLLRVSFIIAISLSLFGLRFAYDLNINGANKAQMIEEKADRLAKKGYKPTDIQKLSERIGILVNLKEKGTTIHELFSIFNWHKLSFHSFFGMYGYMTISSQAWVYDVYFLYSLGIFLSLFLIAMKKFNYLKMAKLTIGVGLMIMMVSLSIAHSWINDFQPQGKYLFPLIGILFLLFHALKIQNKALYFMLFSINLFTVYAYYSNCVLALAR